MENPIVVRDCAILMDPRRRIVEVVNHGKASFTVTSATIEIRGLPGVSKETIPISTPFTILAEEYKPLYSHELDKGITQFRENNRGADYFEVKITLARTQASERTTQHATFFGKFVDTNYEIDRFPFESSID